MPQPGWTVSIDANGNVTATPPRGSRAAPIRSRSSRSRRPTPNLEAQTTVDVTITPTQPGIKFTVASDPLFTVPFNGAQLPTAFRATIQNLGPAADTYNLTFCECPERFHASKQRHERDCPGGRDRDPRALPGAECRPAAPGSGTVLSFQVTATSTSDKTITKTQTVTFTVPAIDALTVTSNPRR